MKIDGVDLTPGDAITDPDELRPVIGEPLYRLLTECDDPADNGVYEVTTGGWTRPAPPE